MINFFKKAYEIYHMCCIIGFCLILDAIVIGVVLVAPLLWILDNVECPF